MAELDRIVLNGVTYDIGSTGSGVTESLKTALLQLAEKVAYIDENGQNYYDALQAALYPPADLVSISAVYTQVGTIYDTDTLDDLKPNLVVTAHMSDSTTHAITNYILSGTLTEGTSVITASYGGKSTTFNVTVTHYTPIQAEITWTGGGVESTSTVIDASDRDVYLEIPFDSTDSRIKSGATSESLTLSERALLYTDSACTQLAGYWYIDTQTLETSKRLSANQPYVAFDTEVKIAPEGYYVKIVLEKMNTDVFASNSDALSYLNAKVTSVTLR